MDATELTWADRMLQQGEQRGRRETIRRVVHARCGRVSPEVGAALDQMTQKEDLTAFIGRRCGAE